MLATQEVVAIYIGVRLRLYDALATGGATTPPGLAERARIAPRYAREWLEQQAVAGLLEVEDPSALPDERVYCLPPEHAVVLCISDHVLSMVSLAVLPVGGIAQALPRLLDAYRDGTGV